MLFPFNFLKTNTTTPLLLDLYPNSTAAYSLRKLTNAYSGSVIRVRRASDNTEQDIGFVSNVLDTASLLSFCSATDGFVVTWYSQIGGSTMDVIQTTAIKQPKIVIGGVLNTLNGKVSIQYRFANNTALVTANGVTVQSGQYLTYAVASTTTTGTPAPQNSSIINQDDQQNANARVAQYIHRNFNQIRHLIFFTDGTSAQVLSLSININQQKMYVTDNINNNLFGSQINNGFQITNSYSKTMRTNVVKLTIGAGNNGFGDFHDGEIQEAVIFNGNNSVNKSNIITNGMTYYGIV
jgi:hypothetical protein